MTEKMTSFERVMATLDHEETDRVPTFILGADEIFYKNFMEQIGFTPEEIKRFITDGIYNPPPLNHGLALKMGFDCSWYVVGGPSFFDAERKSLISNIGGLSKIVVNEDGTPRAWYLEPGLTSKKKIKEWWEMGRPEKFSQHSFNRPIQQLKVLRDKYEFLMMVGIGGPFEAIVQGIGLGQLSRYCRKEPDFMREILERNFEVQKLALELLMKNKPPVVMCGDDYGFNDGLQMNPKYWREYIKPILKKYVEIVHSYDAKFILHSCGKIQEIFPDFVEIGIDGVESLKPKINDLTLLKRKYGDKIALLGTVDDTHLLVECTPDQVKKEVSEQLMVLGKGGGYVPGATNFLMNQKIENIQAMVETIQNFKC